MALADANYHPALPMASNSFGLTAQKSVVQATNAIINGVANLFTVAGGPVYAKLVGIVSVTLGGASNGTLKETTISPASTATLSTTVAIDSAAAGTSIRFVGATGVLTPTTVGAAIIDPVTVDDCWFLLPVGTVTFTTTAARTGNIQWFMNYIPLSPDSIVSAV